MNLSEQPTRSYISPKICVRLFCLRPVLFKVQTRSTKIKKPSTALVLNFDMKKKNICQQSGIFVSGVNNREQL